MRKSMSGMPNALIVQREVVTELGGGGNMNTVDFDTIHEMIQAKRVGSREIAVQILDENSKRVLQ